MNPNADAADQVVKITLEGAEWAIRLAGTGAKNLGVMLYAMSKEQNKTRGAERLNNMLRSGKPLKAIQIKFIDEVMVEIMKRMKDYGGQSDIMLTRGSEVLIIDAKYYTHTTQTQYDVHTLHSGNLYQIFTYVKNKDTEFGDQPHKVSGMLLYAATDEAIQPDNSYQMSGNKISVKTLDLNRDFSEIAAQLNAIVTEHFS